MTEYKECVVIKLRLNFIQYDDPVFNGSAGAPVDKCPSTVENQIPYMGNIGMREKNNAVSVGMGWSVIIGLDIFLHLFVFPCIPIRDIRVKLKCFFVLLFGNFLLVNERIGMCGNMVYNSLERNIAGSM